jgi:branched-chain amino acid transport system ATP-binding protein
VNSTAGTSTPLLSVADLRAGYGKLVVLQDVKLAVEPGQFVAMLGPNGSGKSTLLKAIFNLADVHAGSIVMEGRSLLGIPTETVSRRGIAYVPQRENVFASMSVYENLRLAVRQLAHAAAQQAVADAYRMFPILEERHRQRAGQLSGGERQMLAIALGWLTRPRLMLLDEPSAGLAPLIVTEIFRTLRQLCQTGITLVVVEQNARSILRWCDYAYVLREGQIAFQGSAEQILADEETVKEYLGVATRKWLETAGPQSHG